MDKITCENCILEVTILILVEGSLQSVDEAINNASLNRHNPYFSRRFFAICIKREGLQS